MLWVILAARASDNPESPLRAFIPKMTAFLVLGTAFVAAARWNIDPRLSAIEVGFAGFYIIVGYAAIKIFDAKVKRPRLTAVNGGKRGRP